METPAATKLPSLGEGLGVGFYGIRLTTTEFTE
jgi:hypothetical protein